eukprot:gnl/Chilomastix_caulleri/4886.p1 GENE.gnl/Chilomastix_caulleri/4886~~gnl/Chilomastix_caulleri/4886.p1  ORF type:complete len:115 (-),score=13.81 gnl/Chilomastix_caulleri/4886:254-598(-)
MGGKLRHWVVNQNTTTSLQLLANRPQTSNHNDRIKITDENNDGGFETSKADSISSDIKSEVAKANIVSRNWILEENVYIINIANVINSSGHGNLLCCKMEWLESRRTYVGGNMA